MIATNVNCRTYAAFEKKCLHFRSTCSQENKNFLRESKNNILIRTFTSKWWPDYVSKTRQLSQKTLETLSSLSDNKTWWEIWINKPNCSTSRILLLIVIPNHIEKHVDRTSQIKIVLYREILRCLKRIICYQDVIPTFNKHFGSVTDSLNLLSWPEDILMSSANGTINSTIKKFAFQRSIKTIKNKIKIKSEFSFNHTETIKRITNDIGIKKNFLW